VVGAWGENDFKDVLKIFDENIHNTHCPYYILKEISSLC